MDHRAIGRHLKNKSCRARGAADDSRRGFRYSAHSVQNGTAPVAQAEQVTPDNPDPDMFDIIYSLEMIGVVAFAISGMMVARSKNMDPVGIFTIAFVTALGGGTLRDLMMDNHPLYWIKHQEQPILILVMAIIFSYWPRMARIRASRIVFPDAIGLAVFSILGAQLALDLGHSLFIASLLGVMTGTFGGALRDTFCNEVPFIFRKDQIYATISFAGCWLYFLCQRAIDNETLALSAGLVFIIVVRMLAVHFDIRLQREPDNGDENRSKEAGRH
jgi:uncharacterized membrane protein YeiH